MIPTFLCITDRWAHQIQESSRLSTKRLFSKPCRFHLLHGQVGYILLLPLPLSAAATVSALPWTRALSGVETLCFALSFSLPASKRANYAPTATENVSWGSQIVN